MFDAAQIMSGDSPPIKDRCIIEYELKQRTHTLTLMQYGTGAITKLVVSNLMFDNGLNIENISDVSLTKRDNSCWSLQFGIHSKANVHDIVKWKSVTFIDSRLWVSSIKLLKCTKWRHPYTEMSNGMFNARCGHCNNTMDIVRRLIVIGSSLEDTGKYNIEKINKHGFMQIETDSGLIVQHLNNFDVVSPEDIRGVWFNEDLNLWVFEDTDRVNYIDESYVYLLLDTHSKRTRFLSKDWTGQIYTYDYTKAKAFFSESEAVNCAAQINRRMHTTFTAEQWI